MTTSGPQTATETTIRMCTPGNGWHGTASDRGEAAASDQQGFLIGPGGKELGKWTRRWLTDTLDGKDVKSLHLITHCFSFGFGFGSGVASRDSSRGRAMQGGPAGYLTEGEGEAGMEAEACVKAEFPAVCLIASCRQKCGLAVNVSSARAFCVTESRVRRVESVDSFASG